MNKNKKIANLEEAVAHLEGVQDEYNGFGEYDSYGRIISDIKEHIQIYQDSIDKEIITKAQFLIQNGDDDTLEKQSTMLQEKRLLNENCEWTDRACDLMGWPHEATSIESGGN